MSARPSGVTISRNGNKFKITWKRPRKYTAEQFGYSIVTSKSKFTKASNLISKKFDIKKGISWTKPSISGTETNYTVTLNLSSYYPSTSTKVAGIIIRVRGKYNKKWSPWAYKTFKINEPKAPVISTSWDENDPTKSSYSWTNNDKKDDAYPFTNIGLESVIVKDCPGDTKSLSQWKTAQESTFAGNNGTSFLDTGLTGSWTRCVRIRAKGIGGCSDWRYAKHVWATPEAPTWISKSADYDPANQILNVSGEWTVPQDAQHPVDEHTFEYCVGVPGINGSLPTTPTWNPIETQKIDNTKTVAAGGQRISQAVLDDECVWLRVKARHDNKDNYSNVNMDYTGMLAAPTDISISDQDDTTHRVTIHATNASQVPDSFLVVVYAPGDSNIELPVAIIPHGSSSVSGVQCPEWTSGKLGFKVYAAAGSYSYTQDSDNVRHYNVNAYIISASEQIAEAGGDIPLMPENVVVTKSDVSNAISVSWDWSWEKANQAEISWSTKPNAWRSTDEPDTYIVTNTYESLFDIGELNLGETYYVRVRLLYVEGENITYGKYSDIKTYYLSEAPLTPVARVSNDAVKTGEKFTVSWTYISADGTPQIAARVLEENSGVYTQIASATTGQSAVVDPEAVGWTPGSKHNIVVEVTSASNQTSGRSDAINVAYVAPLSATLTSSLVLVDDDHYELQSMPMTAKVTGAGRGYESTIIIKRFLPFVQDRPDDTLFQGYEGEVVYKCTYPGDAQQTITINDLVKGANLDDTAWYTLEASVRDDYGQEAKADPVNFVVAWTNQAVEPVGSVEVNSDGVAFITIGTPEGALGTEKIDIYRLSVDAPVLLYQNASFGNVIVDPYPAIGDLGGYRIVLRTANGDVTTADGEYAWIDVPANFKSKYQYIDFDGYQLKLLYNVDLSSQFSKNFATTNYLGGSITGDWLEGVKRTGSVSGVLITESDVDDIQNLRRLAAYSGPVHVRTKDGSSFTANVNVDESRGYNEAGKPIPVTLSYERTDAIGMDGVTRGDYNAE